jgi:hypothetical protein
MIGIVGKKLRNAAAAQGRTPPGLLKTEWDEKRGHNCADDGLT